MPGSVLASRTSDGQFASANEADSWVREGIEVKPEHLEVQIAAKAGGIDDGVAPHPPLFVLGREPDSERQTLRS